MSAPDSTPSDYAGLSKQEVAERLKNPTPDATATPRSGVPDAEYWKAHYERIERELAATKAEIAIYKARETCAVCGTSWDPSLIEAGECIFCTLRKAHADNAQLRAEVELYAALRSRLCAYVGSGTPERSREHDARLMDAVIDREDQLRARVAELEADKARLDWLENAAAVGIANTLRPLCAGEKTGRVVKVGLCERSKYYEADTVRAAIDAARAGKGAT